jgi:hypothetical protein
MGKTYVKFQDFIEQVGKGVHQLHAAGHTLNVYLSNHAPVAATDTVIADIPGITEQFGYAAADIQNDYTEAGGTGTLTAVDVTWTAVGGAFGPFQYAVIYNSSTAGGNLVAYYDYGSAITINAGESFKVDFGAALATFA